MVMPLNSIPIPDEILTQYDEVARATGQSRDDLMINALRDYISSEAWFVSAVQRGIEAAEAGDFVPEEEMQSHWQRWTGE